MHAHAYRLLYIPNQLLDVLMPFYSSCGIHIPIDSQLRWIYLDSISNIANKQTHNHSTKNEVITSRCIDLKIPN